MQKNNIVCVCICLGKNVLEYLQFIPHHNKRCKIKPSVLRIFYLHISLHSPTLDVSNRLKQEIPVIGSASFCRLYPTFRLTWCVITMHVGWVRLDPSAATCFRGAQKLKDAERVLKIHYKDFYRNLCTSHLNQDLVHLSLDFTHTPPVGLSITYSSPPPSPRHGDQHFSKARARLEELGLAD